MFTFGGASRPEAPHVRFKVWLGALEFRELGIKISGPLSGAYSGVSGGFESRGPVAQPPRVPVVGAVLAGICQHNLDPDINPKLPSLHAVHRYASPAGLCN